MKKENGITLVLLIITLGVMAIIASTVVYISLDRFEINNLRMLKSDLELLRDSVSNYYLKYGGLPILRSGDTEIKYTYTTLAKDYYILDLAAMGNMSLNYGKEGYENPNASNDVYVINKDTHTIYYVKGVMLKNKIYHYIDDDGNYADDTIPPTKPQIRVISGLKNDEEIYVTEVKVEIIPGIDSISSATTSYTIYYPNSTTKSKDGNITKNYIITLNDDGEYNIVAETTDSSGNKSESATLKIVIQKESGEHTHNFDDGIVIKEQTCTEAGITQYTCTICGEMYTEDIPAALGHNYTEQITKAATCTTDGEKTYTEVISATGHNYKNIGTVQISPASCTSAKMIGEKMQCQNCSSSYYTNQRYEGEALGHFFDELVDSPRRGQKCDCRDTHYAQYKCSRCSALLSERRYGHFSKTLRWTGDIFRNYYYICDVCGITIDISNDLAENWDSYYGQNSSLSNHEKGVLAYEYWGPTCTCIESGQS